MALSINGLLSLMLSGILVTLTVGQEPINRMFSVDAGKPTPDLKCVVGFLSIENNDIFRVNCSEAHEIEIEISKDIRKNLKWAPGRRTLRMGSQPDGSPWPGPVSSWVCATKPMMGTVTFNCVPENQAPDWYKMEVNGPAPGLHKRIPGCNGAVCFCNNADYCNALYAEVSSAGPRIMGFVYFNIVFVLFSGITRILPALEIV